MRRLLAASAALTLSLLAPASAAAGEILATNVSVADAVKRSCIDESLSGGKGYATRSVTAPASGGLTARLEAPSGDWDLAVFDAQSGRRVSGSAYFGASEVANGLVAGGQKLTVQVCRRSGSSRTASLTVVSQAIDPNAKVEKASLVRVSTPNRDRKNELTGLGLDVSEHAGDSFIDVVLHGPDDAKTLRESKFMFTTQIADLAAQGELDRAADRSFARSVSKSALPSGSEGYRTLEDFNAEMKQLVEDNPTLVKPIVLPFKTYEGRTVQGIEITNNVNARDGKPVFLQLALHHAREWPSGEHAMEWAYELVNGSKAPGALGDRVRGLLARTRTIVIPVVNPDGFNHSRTRGAAAAEGPGGGRGAPNPGQEDEIANIVSNPTGEYRRKNCRLADDSEAGNCDAAFAAGLAATGVDPNRNYGGLWGGPGASDSIINETYRGPGPFSEPETKNVRDLVSKRHVTTLITNHTFSDLILRPPGVQTLGPPPDENRGYKALGDAMAAENGYLSQKGYELYDTTGTTEDWTYPATGGFGFTFEIGCVVPEEADGKRIGCNQGHFHPPYSEVVKEYEGTTDRADETRDGQGNREAYFIALQSTANAARHSVIEGQAPAGAVLRLKKTFMTKTSPVIRGGEETDVIEFEDNLNTSMAVPSSGDYEWHINPSTRPAVAVSTGRVPSGDPSPKVEFTGTATTAAPSGDANDNTPGTFNDHAFTVPANGPGVDNEKFTVRIQWQTITSDWDTRLYRDANANGTVDAGDSEVGTSQQGTTDFEQVTLSGPDLAGAYVFRVNNFAATEPYKGTVTFQGPDPFVAAQVERWTLTCEGVDGKVAETRQVLIDRGEVKTESFGAPCAKVAAEAIERRDAAIERRNCLSVKGGVKPRAVGKARLGRTRVRQRRALGAVKRLNSRRGIDRYCVRGGGGMRVGYPTKRLNSKMSRQSRKRVRRKAILAVTSSRRFRVSRVRVGTSIRVLRKRLRGERRHRVGRNVWFTARGKKSRLLFSTRGGKVRQLGLGDRGLTSTRRGTQRFLRAWDKRGL